MTELRRSSRVRQLTKNSPQYYEPDEKKSILSTPHVRPRKWRSSEVSVGYFMVRRWVPRDQEHLTADLHGGLTEKAEVVTPAKPAMRAGSKGSARSKTRTRPSSASSPAGAASRARAPAFNRGEVRTPGLTPPPSPHPPAVPPTAGLPGAAPLSGTATAVLGGGRAGGRAGDASLAGVRGGGAGKRPASAMGRSSGAEGSPALLPPAAKSRRVSTEGAGLPLGPGSPGSRGSAGQSTANWKRKRQSQNQSQTQKPSVWTTQLGNESLKAKKGGKALVPGGEGAVGAGRGVGAMWGAGVGNGAPSRQWKV